MLKYLNGDKIKFIESLELILDKRRSQSSKKFAVVKKIIADVIKNKDNAIIRYEKKFSKTKKR